MADDRGIPVFSAQDITLSYGGDNILDGLTLNMHEDDRIGLLGRNGCGKSSLLKIIASGVAPSGILSYRRGMRLGVLPQDFMLDDTRSVLENILDGAKDIAAMLVEYEALPHDSVRAHELEDRLTLLKGWDLEAEARSLVLNLGTPPADALVEPLSGGEKRRIALAKTLISQPDLLILDEPTNHLDSETIEWLEGTLRQFKGAILIVTHDRFFLDRVTNRIAELDKGRLTFFEGNYSSYLEQKSAMDMASEVVEHKRQQHLKKELAWVRAGVKARGCKSKSRVARYHAEASEEGFTEKLDIDLVIPKAPVMGNRTAELKNVSKNYGDKSLFDGLDIAFEPDKRIGVVGRNGLGKSTLLKIILGEVQPDVGTVEIGPRTVFNYIDQNRLNLNPDNSVLQELAGMNDWVKLGDETISARGYLRRFLFSDERINTKVGRLSGGERSRLLMAKILKNGGNFLILDEPTNDLDLPTLRLLEEALVAFEGSVLVISHDRYFLNRVCQQIVAFEGNGVVVTQEGDYDYYLEKRQERLNAAKKGGNAPTKNKAAAPAAAPVAKATAAPVKAATPAAPAAPARKLKWAEQKELDVMEASIAAAEAALEEIEGVLADPTTYMSRSKEIPELKAKRQAASDKVAAVYARWEELEKLKG